MENRFEETTWYLDNWSRVALPAAIVMLLSLPILLVEGNRDLILLYALLPIYMIHQYEEHARGRFVAFFNATIGQGHEVLTEVSAFWINILLVWGLFLALFSITRYWTMLFVFVPIYATLLNGIVHIATSLAIRRYNPGLYTSVALFLPWSIFCLIYFSREAVAPWRDNIIGLIGGILIHAIIVVYAVAKRRRLEAMATVPAR
jgi:hypothetical protein